MVNCSMRKVGKTNCRKNMAYCNKNMVLLLNCSKNMVNCSKRKVGKINCSKNMVNCSRNMVLLLNCSKNMEVET